GATSGQNSRTISPSVVLMTATSLIEFPRLLRGVRGDNLDALNRHALHRLARFAVSVRADRSLGNFFQRVVAFDQLAERGVLVVEAGSRGVADEELAAGGIRIARPSHRDDAPLVFAGVELGVDRIARAALAVGRFLRGILRVRLAALDHETVDDAMERGAVIKT